MLKIFSELDIEKLDKISDVGVYHHYLKTHIVKDRVFLALDNVTDYSKEQAKSFLEAKFGDGSVVLATAHSKEQLQRVGVNKEDCFPMPELELEEAESLFLSSSGVEKNEVDQVLLEKCVKRCYLHKGPSSSSGDGMYYHPLALKVLGTEVGDFIREHGGAKQTELLTRIDTFNPEKSFVADLNDSVKRRDRHPFLDRLRSSLPVGDIFPDLISDAIGQCQVGVVILSEEFFTRSKRPRLELVATVEEPKKPNDSIKIVPVFNSISCSSRDPTVQDNWMDEFSKKREEENKSALGSFGSTTGLELKDGMFDGELRAEIVDAIGKDDLSRMRWDASKVEGKSRMFQVIRKMVYKGSKPKDLKGGVQMVGLYGIGGIGKTTICKMLCNELSRDYSDRVCHVEFGSLSEVELLKKTLGAFSNLNGQMVDKISDVGVGHGYLKTCIVKERVFLVLDNVSDDSKEQAKSYLKAKFGDGSVVLMTARSMDQLLCLGVEEGDCFEMPTLEFEEAKSLFLSYACMEKNEIDEVLLEKCVKRCCFQKGQSSSASGDGKHYHPLHYHPLALKVLGNEVGDFIRKHGVARQAAVLTRINTFNLSRQKEHPVFSILRSSFDSLLEEDQLLFLHAAVFLPVFPVGYGSLSCGALEWLGMVGGGMVDIEWRLELLKRRSLLESFGDDVDDFCIHDIWREFAATEIELGYWKGRHFLYESAKCNGKVDLTGFPKVRVVKLVDVADNVALDVWGLKQLKSLEVVLETWEDSIFEVNGLGTLESITYLRCDCVALSACISELGWLTKLEVVELVGFKGDKLPDMSKLTHLRKLNLNFSKSLRRVSLRNLSNLTDLYVDGCISLQSVDLSGCRSITDRFHFMLSSTLEELNVSSCPLLASSVLGLAGLTKLRKLDITGCSSINELDGLRRLAALEELRATHCDKLIRSPRCRLPKLRVLDIEPGKVPPGFQSELGVTGIRRFKGTAGC